MLMVGFRGLEVGKGDPILDEIRTRGLGGVVLFDYDVPTGQAVRNIASPEQVQALTAALQAAAATPLWIAVDHEGGLVTRLKEEYGFPATRSHSALGAAGDVEATYTQAVQMGETLASCGINLNLAPVVDLCANLDNPIIARYERCFAAAAAAVAEHASAFVRGHHTHGIRCTLKHFPGHGSSTADSHLGLVDVSETWAETELEPYTALIQAGLADAIMTAHVFNTRLDPDYPATLSAAVIDGLLRGRLGYEGVVISDDMQMGAITRHYGFNAAIRRALEAGVDILAFANQMVYQPDVTTRAAAEITRLVKEGTVPAARIEASYRRIMALKEKNLMAWATGII